jgi:hypothetical protein
LTYFFGRVHDSDDDIREFSRAGIDVFSGCFGPSLGPDGTWDFEPLRERLDYVVRANPRVLILPRIGVHWIGTAHPWFTQYADEMQVNIHPVTGQPQRIGCFSLSSSLWRQHMIAMLRQTVRWCEERYAGHILGYHIGAGAAGEWSYGWVPALSDTSAPQARAFGVWLRQRYGDDRAALRKAWNRDDIDFDTAEVPTDRTRADGGPLLLDPARERRIADYLTFHSAAMARAALDCARATKQALADAGRQKVCGVFYGYHFKNLNRPANFFNAGHFASDAVLGSPDIDFVAAPYDYTGREPGGMYLAQAIAGSIRLAGKLYWCEEDTFTHLSKREPGRSRCPDRATTIGVLRRNLMGVLRDGGTAWWMDCGGNGRAQPGGQVHGWYRDEAIMAEFARLEAMARKRLDCAGRAAAAQVAVLLSDSSISFMRQDESLIDALVFGQMLELGALGASFDTYRVEDLPRLVEQPCWPGYRFVVVLDALHVPEAARRAFDQAVKVDGRTVLWLYAAGLITDDALSPQAMERLTGLRVAVRDANEMLLANCFLTGQRTIYGTQRLVRPVVCGDDPNAQVAGRYVNTGDVAILRRDFGVWRSVWSGAPALPASALRHLAREAGVHLYVDTGDQVLSDGEYLTLHAAFDGPRTVRLPLVSDVSDAWTGQVVARRAQAFDATMDRGQTCVWRVQPCSATCSARARSPTAPAF